MISSGAWTGWRTLSLRLSDAVLAETLDGGQAFRWLRQSDGSWLGHWSECVAKLRCKEGLIQGSFPEGDAERMEKSLRHYLWLDSDFEGIAGELPCSTDPHIRRCRDAFPGLRILRQPFGETLLGFLCSATKQIAQIKQMLALLSQRHGSSTNGPGRSLPTWTTLAQLRESDLRACLLGFRARYVHETALFLQSSPGWLEQTACLPYLEAKERLLLLPGVGGKIADCVLLFGAGRLEAFPVDVWILKAMAERYSLADWKPAHVAHFGRVHFGPLAGLAQQYLFAYERQSARRPIPAG